MLAILLREEYFTHMKYILAIGILTAVLALAWFGFIKKSGDAPPGNTQTTEFSPSDNVEKNPIVVLRTTKGEVLVELFMDKTPITAGNFLKLVKEGFYDGTKFHRIIKGFMIQGGDPNSKDDNISLYGRGGPGYMIQDEFVKGLSNVRGTIAMANTGQQNSGGSQFFINLVNNTGLDFDKEPFSSSHSVFGKVVGGMNVVDEIANAATGPGDVPIKPIVVEQITIRR